MNASSNVSYVTNSHNAKEWQAAILKHLSVFDTFCEQHNISYSLCFGGLLGAVRHRNIIPWDNDVDVVMNLENYKKLQKLFLEGKFPENFALTDYELDPNYPLLFGRFINTQTSCPLDTTAFNGCQHGIFIDIFLVLPLPDSKKKQESALLDFMVWDELQCNIHRRSSKRPTAFIKRWKQLKKFEKEHGREAALEYIRENFFKQIPSSWDEASYCFYSSTGSYNGSPVFKTEWFFGNQKKLPLGNVELYVPADYHAVLCTEYGYGWRLFPNNEKFKPYSCADTNIPGDVVSEDYMQFFDNTETMDKLILRKDLLMEKLVYEHSSKRLIPKAKAQAYAKRGKNKLHEYLRLLRDSKVSSLSLQSSREQARKTLKFFSDLLKYENDKDLSTWNIAIPYSKQLLDLILESMYLSKNEYWLVDKKMRFYSSLGYENQALDTAIKLTESIYCCIESKNYEELERSCEKLLLLCPHSIHVKIAKAYQAFYKDDFEASSTYLDNIRTDAINNDYFALLEAMLDYKKGKIESCKKTLLQLSNNTSNGIILLLIKDFYSNVLKETYEFIPRSNKTSSKPTQSMQFKKLRKREWYPHYLPYLVSRSKKIADTKLKELNSLLAPLNKYTSDLKKMRRLTSDRLFIWDRVYPRKESIINAAANNDTASLQKLALPLLKGIYRRYDEDHIGLFVDKGIYTAIKPLLVQERGEAFIEDYFNLIPEPHKNEDISDFLYRHNVDHPYLNEKELSHSERKPKS